jgi:hypothetical protein
MVSNNRIYWACQGVSIAPQSSPNFTAVHGLQSIGITTTFNLEQVFEIGQLAIYENIEAIPDIEVTMEKVLDGYPLLYHLSTRGYASTSLAGRSARKCNVMLSIYDDTNEFASGIPQSQVTMSGMYISSVSYSLPVDGNCTESVTLVGNNKVWKTTLAATNLFGGAGAGTLDMPDTTAANIIASGGVQRRENVVFGSNTYASKLSTILPNEIQGISSSGTNNLVSDVLGAHIQTVSVSCDLGREALNELGRRGPYFRYVNFPVEVTCEIETTSAQGDKIDATEAGINGSGYNLTDQTILLVMQDSTKIDLGTRNKLASVSYGGADAGGGNATVTYSYTTFNDFVVTQNSDPVS